MATTIDALGLAEDFEKAGFPRDQAIGMARAIRDHSHETLATKADLHELELRLEGRFEQIDARFAQIDQRFEHLEQYFDARLEHRIAAAQVGMIKWFAGMMVAQATAIVALLKLLPGSAP